MSIDQFFNRRYNKTSYNCAHFAVEVWAHITGVDIAHIMRGFLLPGPSRFARMDLRNSFEKLASPVEPCIVLLQRKGNTPHVGVYIDGRVFHITERGAELQPLDFVAMPFNKVGFYNVK